MSNVVLFEKINKLPDHLKVEVLDFVEFLEQKKASKNSVFSKKNEEIKSPKFGFSKGKYILSPDFDEPLDDFKDYM